MDVVETSSRQDKKAKRKGEGKEISGWKSEGRAVEYEPSETLLSRVDWSWNAVLLAECFLLSTPAHQRIACKSKRYLKLSVCPWKCCGPW